MSSTGVNVLRWSALAFGVFYGFSHQRTITTTQRAQHAQHEYEQKQKLIDQAKAEYAKKNAPVTAATNDGTHDPKDYGMAYASPFSSGVILASQGMEGGHGSAYLDFVSKANSRTAATDVNSPEFDLEKYLLKIAKESP
ncbi:hypothetical protein Trihar35433_953 [Trichoderma harzianum]|nr:hypothetical protein Trihar35433_953 [Trichoderma harzianum]